MAQDHFPPINSGDSQASAAATATHAPHKEPPLNTDNPILATKHEDHPPTTASPTPVTQHQDPLPNGTAKPTVKKNHHGLKLAWLRAVLKAPVRVLRAIRDSYERGMTQCAGSSVAMAGGFSMGATYPPIPRSYSTRSRSSEDDHSELIRAASQSMLATRVLPAAVGPDGVQRSQSAVVWRIDEDKEADFGNDGAKFTAARPAAYSRSRSHAVPGSRAGVHSSSYFPPRRAGVAVA